MASPRAPGRAISRYDDEMTLACPRCRTDLLVAESPAGDVYACASCGGVWLDTVAAQRIATALEPQLISLADAAAAMATSTTTNATSSSSSLACPVCTQAMQRVRVDAAAPPVAASVDIDVCSAHGTWFDRNELQQAWRTLRATRPEPPPDSLHVVGTPVAADWDAPPTTRRAPPTSSRSTSTVDGVQVGLVGIEIAFDIFTILG